MTGLFRVSGQLLHCCGGRGLLIDRAAFALLVLAALSLPLQLRAQDAAAGDPAAQSASPAPAAAPERDVSWRQLPANFLGDQKNIWLFPAHLRHRSVLIPALAVIGATAALVVAVDPIEGRYFRDSTTYLGFNRAVSGNNASIGMLLVPVSFYTMGLIRKDEKSKKTALLAAEAVADAELVTIVMKDIDRRLRPAVIGLHGNYSDTWFQSGGPWLRGQGSFPSGHTIAAASIATVVARRYGREHRWVPYVAYSLAGLVGFSRMTWSSHFLSDVFVGGVFGYSISRFVVLRQ
ncbi:MAG TPA: phosphatase PAP2 family protein [Bryobacteraceae bacterium]